MARLLAGLDVGTATAEPEEPAEPNKNGWDFSGAKRITLTYSTDLADTNPTILNTVRYLDMIKEYTEGTIDYVMYARR